MHTQRAEYIKDLFKREGYQALVCSTPQHTMMLTGYLPMLGGVFCLVSLNHSGEVEVRLAVPTDEQDRVPADAAVEVKTFAVETLDTIDTSLDAAREPLSQLLRSAGIGQGHVVGYEGAVEPIIPAYTQVSAPSPEKRKLLHLLLLGGELRSITARLNEMAAFKTEEDLAGIKRAEEVALAGFQAARDALHVGATEADVAAASYAALVRAGYALPGASHVQPHVHVMAGKRAALAYRAFNLTSNAPIERGESVVVQMEIGINGYWAELTRTFFVGSIDDEWRRVYQACLAAQDAALKVIRPGLPGRDVDATARQILRHAGFGQAFKHGLGHGFGFQAINHAAEPILHPASITVLKRGMVHNIEPAVYLDGKGGFRLNDNVAVHSAGAEVLSSQLPRALDWLVVQ